MLQLIHVVLRPEMVTYFRSPREADGQMAVLAFLGLGNTIITTDSDILLHLRNFPNVKIIRQVFIVLPLFIIIIVKIVSFVAVHC